MEGFILNIIATVGFSSLFLVIFFSVYYLYLKGAEEEVMEEDKNKKLGKRTLK